MLLYTFQDVYLLFLKIKHCNPENVLHNCHRFVLNAMESVDRSAISSTHYLFAEKYEQISIIVVQI